jgi:hypothetical protein
MVCQPDPRQTALFARAFGRTPCESDVLDQLVTGPNTRTLAGELCLSKHIAQDHLKSIFTERS